MPTCDRREPVEGATRTRWVYHGGSRSALEGLNRNWSNLESLPGVQKIKDNQARTVVEVPASCQRPALVIKRQRSDGFFQGIIGSFLPSSAAREAKILRKLANRKIPVPEVLAVVEEWRQNSLVASALVMEKITDGQLFSPWLETLEPRPRRQALYHLGAFLARLHLEGVVHGDLHGGNLLVRQSAGRWKFYLLDVARAKLMPEAGQTDRFLDQVALAQALGGPEHADDVEEMFRGYRENIQRSMDLDDFDRVIDGARVRERRRRRRAIGRCWRTSSQFVTEKRGELFIHRRREVTLAAVEGALVRPSPEGIEVDNWRSPWRLPAPIVRRLGPLHRAWRGERVLEVLRLQAPRLLALVERRQGGLVAEAWLIAAAPSTSPPAGGQSRWLRGDQMNDSELSTLPRWLRKLHDGGARLAPGAPDAFKLGPLERWSVDDTAIVNWQGAIATEDRLRDLAAIASVWDGSISPRDRVRFLCEYCATDPGFHWRRVYTRLDEALLMNFCSARNKGG